MKVTEIIKNVKSSIKKINKRTIYCIIGGVVFGILSFILNKENTYIRPYEIERSTYGTQKASKRISLDVENLLKNIEFDIAISPKKYTQKEADRIFKEKLNALKVDLLGENEDYEHIYTKLNYKSELGDGIRATFSFEPYIEEEKRVVGTSSNADQFAYFVKYQNLVDTNGNVKNEDFKENETCNGYIEIQLSTDIKDKDTPYKSEKNLIPIKIVSKKLSVIESFKNSFKKEVKLSDERTINEDTIKLPKEINDFKINYKEKVNYSFLLMPILGLVMAILLEARDKEKIKEEEKKKTRYLEIDFAQIISKVLLYVSSGMTIRNSMIRLAEDYQMKLKKNKIGKRAAYDELVIVKNKLASGYSEVKAYEEMAKNINMRTYTRFLNIIIQSIKNGNKELKNILNMEVQDALYERKQKAKKLGEEAATKLVMPLMMMLAVIMVVIMVPAFMGM